MAEDKGVARKVAAAEDKSDEKSTTVENPNVIDEPGLVVTQHDVDVINHAKEVLKKEAEGIEDTDGPGDTLDLSQPHDPKDHILSNDPFKKAFPPGPDDPTKL